MKKIINSIFLVSLVVFSSSVLRATNYYVNDGSLIGDVYTSVIGAAGNSGLTAALPKPSIKSVLTAYAGAFVAGDTIFVDAGTYNNLDLQMSSPLNGVVIQGAGQDLTIIDGSGPDKWFMNIDDNNTVIRDMYIKNYQNDGSGTAYGHVFEIAAGVTGVEIINCKVGSNGTGASSTIFPIQVQNGASVLFQGGGSTCNTASGNGGGIRVIGAAADVTIRNYLFYGDERDGVDGGALRVENGTVNVYNSVFEANTIDNDYLGAAVHVAAGTVNVYDCHFNGNFYDHPGAMGANEVGGLIMIAGGAFTIKRSVLQNTTPGFINVYGAAIGVRGGTVAIDSCLFNTNIGDRGTDVHVNGGTVTAFNSTFGSIADQIGGTGGSFTLSFCGTPTSGAFSTGIVFSDNNAPTYIPSPLVPSYIGSCPLITILCTPPAIPTGSAAQSFCSIDNPTVAGLVVIGTGIQWYAAASGGVALVSGTALVNGTHYYASQIVSGCESTTRLDVTVTIADPVAPTGSAAQSFCSIDNPTVADLTTATGSGIQWYAASSGGVALAGGTVLVDGTHYYASQTTGGCESDTRLDVTVTVADPVAPTGNAAQSFCSIDNPTVADLATTTGSGIQWYAASSGGAALAGGTVLVDGTHYYASQTTGGCESDTRLDVTVTVADPVTPTGSAAQSFCSIDNPTVADLTTATGSGIQWYAASSGGVALAGGTVLVDGTHYYASQTTGGCESDTRLDVTVTVADPAAPTGSAAQSFCSIDNPTVADLATTTGSGVQWYAASSGGVALAGGTVLVDGTHYYASQTTGGCESDARLDVTVTVADPAAPTGNAAQSFCSINNPTVADLATTTGSGIQWYAASSGGAALAGGTVLVDGTHYYASQTTGGCESDTRLDVTVTVTDPVAPTGSVTQSFCPLNNPTVADLSTTTGSGIQWYAASSGSVALASGTALVNGTHYYASQTTGGCESDTRLDVTVTVANPVTPTGNAAQSFCSADNPTVADLTTTTGSGIQWYATSSGGVALAPGIALVDGDHYYASQTVNGCESTTLFDVTVTVTVLITPDVSSADTILCIGSTTTISGTPLGGTWNIWDPSIATLDAATGIITAVAPGSTLGEYVVLGTGGCLGYDLQPVFVIIVVDNPVAPVVNTITDPSCLLATGSVDFSGFPVPTGDVWTITATPTAGPVITGSLSDADTTSYTLNGLAASTNYTFTVANSEGCVSVPTGAASIAAQPVTPTAPVIGTITDPTCILATGSVDLSGLPAGGWTVTATPGGATIAGVDPATTGTFSGLTESTSYTFTVTNAVGCTSLSSLSAVIGAQPLIPSVPIVDVVIQPSCTSATGSVDLSGLPATGTWTVTATPTVGAPITGTSTGTTYILTGLAASTTYVFTVTNSGGCTSPATGTINFGAQPAIPGAPTGNAIQLFCASANPTVADLTATGNSIQWYAVSTGGPLLSGAFALVDGNHYYATQTSVFGCESVARLDVLVHLDSLDISVVSQVEPNCYQPTGRIFVMGINGIEDYTYSWSNGSTQNLLTEIGAGEYTVTVTDSLGCTSQLTVELECKAVPEIITVNGNGKNETWVLNLQPEASVQLFNRWGSLIYSASPYMDDWDGKANEGSPLGSDYLPSGTYYYLIDLKNGEKPLSGFIELVR